MIDPAWIAVVGTGLGGLGLKIGERIINAPKERRADRKALRDEIRELNERLDTVEDELSQWRNKYYASQEEILTLKAMVIGAGIDPDKPSKP